jgi:hypothetical protein
MKWSLVIVVMLTVARVADAAEPGQLPVIHLEMRNDAEVPADILKRSQDELARIFGDAGFGVEWSETGPRFTVQMAASAVGSSGAASTAMGVESTVMGVASRTPTGATAQIFVNKVQYLARTYRVDASRLLACVIAHEIGHLLLPRAPHSVTGLMKADWDSDQVREAAAGSLMFTGTQIKRLHAFR